MNSVYAKGELVSARFQIRELIGQGDLGQVYEVWDLSTSSVAALKQFTTPAARVESTASAVERAARVGPQSSPIFIKAPATSILTTGAGSSIAFWSASRALDACSLREN